MKLSNSFGQNGESLNHAIAESAVITLLVEGIVMLACFAICVGIWIALSS